MSLLIKKIDNRLTGSTMFSYKQACLQGAQGYR